MFGVQKNYYNSSVIEENISKLKEQNVDTEHFKERPTELVEKTTECPTKTKLFDHVKSK